MTTSKAFMTAEDLLNLPDDGNRYELVNGELVEMTPSGGQHGGVQLTLGALLLPHVMDHGLGRVLGEVGVRLGPGHVRAPDLCFIARDRLPGGQVPTGFLEAVPDLIVEIISPHDRASDVHDKIQEWLQAGARLVWAVYPSSWSVQAYQGLNEIRIYRADDVLDGAPVLPDFTCPVAALFA